MAPLNFLTKHLSLNPFKQVRITLLMAGVCVIVFFSGDWQAALQMDNAAVWRGEVWRLFTSVWVHSSVDHLQWNIITLVASGCVAEVLNRRSFVVFIGLSVIASALFELWYFPVTYRSLGYSSIAAGVFIVLLIWLMKLGFRQRDWLLLVTATIVCVLYTLHETGLFIHTTGWEALSGRPVDQKTGLQVNPGHLFGMALGLFYGLFTAPALTKQEQRRHAER